MGSDMAGDWIPLRVDIADDPAVIAIAHALGMDEFAVVGRLHHLWSWANRQLENGNATGVTESWIDRYVSATGFAQAMVAAGWLTPQSGGVEFPKFDRWNSQGAKRRILTSRRVALHRNAANVTSALTKEEKRREEKKEKSKSARTHFRPPTPEEVKAYCVERGNAIDPQRFVDYYAANGWRVGKSPMKDWQAAVRTWEKNGFSSSGVSSTPKQQRTFADIVALAEVEKAGAP